MCDICVYVGVVHDVGCLNNCGMSANSMLYVMKHNPHMKTI